MPYVPVSSSPDVVDDTPFEGPSDEAVREYQRQSGEIRAAIARGENVKPLTDALTRFMLANGWADNAGPMDDGGDDTPPDADPGTIARAMVMAAAAGDDQAVDDLHALATKGA